MTRLLIYEPSYNRIQAELAAHGDRLTLLIVDDSGRLSVDGATIDAAEARPDVAWLSTDVYEGPVARDFVLAALKAPDLKWVQSAGAGFDHPIYVQLVSKGARLTTSHGQSIGMAEYVLASVLDHFQRGPERRAAQAEFAWRELRFREVMGSTWLIIGFGAIGQTVARRARGFGAHVVGVRRNLDGHPLADAIAPMEALPSLLPMADVVVLCMPLSAATRHVADAGFFAAMNAGSVLVNVGRGALVDEAALLAALELGAPGHAVLDVFETEPLPADSPFWSHPKVSLTPHASGVTDGQTTRNQALFLDNLARYLAGEPLLHEIDPKEVVGG